MNCHVWKDTKLPPVVELKFTSFGFEDNGQSFLNALTISFKETLRKPASSQRTEQVGNHHIWSYLQYMYAKKQSSESDPMASQSTLDKLRQCTTRNCQTFSLYLGRRII
jgi:hypothetical protein